MNEEQMKALRKALGLPETADATTCITTAQTANSAVFNLNERNIALTTANNAKAELENKLTTANGQVTTLTTERDQLKTAKDTLTTANGTLTTEVETLRTGILDVAEGKGALTPAEREAFKGKLTANAKDTAAELKARKALNIQPIEINGNRVDISTANARQDAFNRAVLKRMKDEGIDRDTAFAQCLADPALASLTGAMADPTRKTA